MIDFDVGKYAAFIWPAYAITVLAFVVLIAGALNHSRVGRSGRGAFRQMSRWLAFLPLVAHPGAGRAASAFTPCIASARSSPRPWSASRCRT
jgi:heme exporter protein CcmD